MAVVPRIGDRGVYTLLSPYQQLLQPNIEYTCEASSRFSAIIEDGVDPFEEYYQPRGLPYSKYEEDALLNATIVRLRSTQNQWVEVPSTYISSVPNPNGVPYHALILGISLGAIPTSLKLDSLKATITNVVKDYIGINSQVEEIVVSDTKAISMSDHDTYEAARISAITISESDRSKALRLQNTIDALTLKNRQLEEYIASRLPP